MPYQPAPSGKQSSLFSPVFSLFIILTVTFLSLLQDPAHANNSLQIKEAMTKYLVCSPLKTFDITPTQSIIKNRALCLSTIYLSVKDYPFWVDEEGPTEAGWAIIHHLENSSNHGLNPRKYDIDQIKDILPSQTPEDLGRLETLLTFGLATYLYDLHGEPDKQAFPPKIDQTETTKDSAPLFDPVALIQKCLDADNLFTFLEQQAPIH